MKPSSPATAETSFPRNASRRSSLCASRRGSLLLEFILMGVPVLFLTISVFEASLMMWQYHTMAEAVQIVAQYVTAHGYNCSNGNSCAITIGNIASYIEQTGVGLDPSKLNVTIASANSSTACRPVNTCTSSSTQFPPATNGDYNVGNDITVSATYTMNNPITMFWPSKVSTSTGVLTLGATSTQRIVF